MNRRDWVCPWCQQSWSIPDGAPDPEICPKCKPEILRSNQVVGSSDFDLPLPPVQYGAFADRPTGQKLAIGGMVGGLIVILLATISGREPKMAAPDPNRLPPVAAAKETVADGPQPIRRVERMMQVGDTVVIDVGSGQAVICYAKGTIDELGKIARADDMVGLVNLIGSGRAFSVPTGTRAKLLEFSFSCRRVRIEEGEMRGRDGWVPMEFVKSIRQF